MDSSKFPPPQPGSIIDATPGSNQDKGIQNTKAWQQASGGIKQGFNRYLSLLSDKFRSQPREEQESLINKFCIIITMGVFLLFMTLFYAFLPVPIRLLAVPLLAGASYFAGAKIITPVAIQRLEKYLN